MNKQTVCDGIEAAIKSFLANDIHLLEVRASERSMCHKLAEVLQVEFGKWHVDCEYNRNGDVPKTLHDFRPDKEHSVYPDIIIHQRGTKNNLIVIEAKCSDSPLKLVNDDRLKLNGYLREHSYSYGVLVTFHVTAPWKITYELCS